MNYPLKARQVCFFILAFLPITKLFTYPAIVCDISHEDAWLSIMINGLIDLLSLSAILVTCLKTKKDFYTLIEEAFGKTGSKIVLSLYIVFFLLKAVLPINEYKDYIEYTLYETMPNIVMFLPFFIISTYLCLKKIRVMGRCCDILWIVTILGIVVLYSFALPNAKLSAILPIGVNGIQNALLGAYKGMPWFGDCVYIMLLTGRFNCEKKDALKINLCYLITVLINMFIMIAFLGVFQSTANRQRFALSDFSKYSSIVNHVGRDFFGIFLILFSNTFACILPIYFASEILQRVIGFKKSWISSIIINALMFLIIVFLRQYFASIENIIVNYVSGFFLIMSNVFPLFIPLFIKKEKKCVQESLKV